MPISHFQNARLQLKPSLGTPINRSHPIARNMVGAWLFNGNCQALTYESISGGQNSAKYSSGTITPIVTRFGTGLQFGTGASYLVGHNPQIDDVFHSANTNGGTFLLWGRCSGAGFIIEKDNGGNAGWALITNTGQWRFRLCPSGAFMNCYSNATAVASQVYASQCVVVWNGANNLLYTNYTMYVNGLVSATDTVNSGNGSGATSSDATVNMQVGNGGAQIDHMLLWKRQLTAVEIRTLFETPFCFMNQPTMPAHWSKSLAARGRSFFFSVT